MTDIKKRINQKPVIFLSFVLGLISGGSLSYYFINQASVSSSELINMNATILFDEGKSDQALGMLWQSIALNPENYSPYMLIGKIYLAEDKPDLALKAYEKALMNSRLDKGGIFDKNEKVIKYDVKKMHEIISKLKTEIQSSKKLP